MGDNKSTWADWDKVFADTIAQNDAVIKAWAPDPEETVGETPSGRHKVRLETESQIILTHLVKRNHGLTTCCGRTWTELPLGDHCTMDETLSNCQGSGT